LIKLLNTINTLIWLFIKYGFFLLVLAILAGILMRYIANYNTIRLENNLCQQIHFKDLPENVKKIYSSSAVYKVREKSWKEIFLSSNKEDSVSCITYTMMQLPKLIKYGFKHRFYINGKIFILDANKGDPFIKDSNYIYFPDEFGITHLNCKNYHFMKINLDR